MGIWKGASCLVFLGLLMHTRGQGDFDLADALDDPGPTKKPNSDIYPKPKPPYHPQPGSPDNSGNIYPRPKPPSRPLPGNFDNSGGYGNNIDHHGGGYPPRPRPPAGGGGYHPSYDADGNSQGGRGRYRPNSGYGGGGGHSTYGNPQEIGFPASRGSLSSFLRSCRQHDSEDCVSHCIRCGCGIGGGSRQAFYQQQEEKLLQLQRTAECMRLLEILGKTLSRQESSLSLPWNVSPPPFFGIIHQPKVSSL
ncbi:glycoprotein Xg-like isoform X2 [Dasypus novemcinctus]|uniref:glycoprotein Xg isoform X2 n=1 Tax=Dasypus novemcinctus TaxID=9361 RepID=UPI000C8169B5|nr:glycoprotein Xg isoform X2 [Dasypus novemcinctus]